MPTTHKDFEKLEAALRHHKIEVVKKILQDFDVTATTNRGRSNCLGYVCTSSSPEAMKLVFEKIIEVGGSDLLKKQLSSINERPYNCLREASNYCSSREVVTLLASVLFYLDLLKEQYSNLSYDEKSDLQSTAGVDFAYWYPDRASLDEVKKLLEGEYIPLKQAVHKNDHPKIKELLADNNVYAKKTLELTYPYIHCAGDSIIMQACAGRTTTVETIELLFSQIKKVGGGGRTGDEYLKQLLSKENTAGETSLVCACSRYTNSERLGLFLRTIEEVGGEDLLVRQISKKRRTDGMTCLYALCQFAPTYDTLSLLVSKIFQSEFLGRRFLRGELGATPFRLHLLSSAPLEGRFQVSVLDGAFVLYHRSF